MTVMALRTIRAGTSHLLSLQLPFYDYLVIKMNVSQASKESGGSNGSNQTN
jgi:hypothetical protein